MSSRIAVCIPCAPKDRGYLRYCLLSVQAQTRPADFVVVSLSIIQDPAKLILDLSGITMPVHFLYHKEDLFAGANRNRAAVQAVELGADILSFFDADDIMHPRRLECIEYHFKTQPQMTGLLHHFLVGPKLDMQVYKGEKEIPWEPIINHFLERGYEINQYRGLDIIKFQRCFIKNIRRGYGMAANGHISVKASHWINNPYRNDVKMGEDNHFSASILRAKEILGYTCDTLSLYMRADFKHIQVGI